MLILLSLDILFSPKDLAYEGGSVLKYSILLSINIMPSSSSLSIFFANLFNFPIFEFLLDLRFPEIFM